MYSEVHVSDIIERASSPEVSLLFALYETARAGEEMPGEDRFGLSQLGPLSESCLVLDPVGDDDFIYRHYGRQIAQISGFDMNGKRVSDFMGDVGAFFAECYRRCIAERRPLFTLHRATYAVKVHVWERLLLPVRLKDGGIRILALAKVREFKLDLLNTMFDAFDFGIFALRFLRRDGGQVDDAVIVMANRKAESITRRTPQDLIGKRALEIFPGLVASGIWSRYLWVASTRKPLLFENEYHADGVDGVFEINLLPLGDGVMVAFADITERRNRENIIGRRLLELERENEGLRALLRLNPDGANEAGAKDGLILRANGAPTGTPAPLPV